MPRDEVIVPYKLEEHLREICNNNEAYANLLSVWNINKNMCQDILSTVVMNYPHYTRHDISHCEAIITNIEMLLGEETIKSLSPTDTWLLLHAAYLHDIGMVVECKKIEENWETSEFQEYLHELEFSSDESLAENAKFINSLGDKLGRKENVFYWPVRVRYAVTLIIAEYYRKHHAEDSRAYIREIGKSFNFDLGFNGLIPQRLIILLADIVGLHTEKSKKVLDLDYRTNGFNADYAHPRFIVQMLRMGDLLDADNNRYNISNETVFGKIPESSKIHWSKHMSARHILITPDLIEYSADCNEIEVYRETRVFLSWLKEEIEFWALNWKSIMPKQVHGSAPKLGKCELFLDGVPDINGLSDLRFSISPEKAFELIEGSNIYDDKFVFLREVIQNSLDACKIQLWRDLLEERYKSWINKKDFKDLQPFDIQQEVFDNYVIEVKLCEYDKEHFKVIVRDNGIGISAEQLKKICNVGESYKGDKKINEEIKQMPLWLRPTAGFGIGLQSIFLVTDEFEIYSKSSSGVGIHARVVSRRKNGYVQIAKSDKLKKKGTEIHIIIRKNEPFKIGRMRNTLEYVENDYDPFSAQENMLYYKLWDILCETMGSTYFSVKLFFEEQLVDEIKARQFIALENASSNGRYLFNTKQNFIMDLWDLESCTAVSIQLQDEYEICKNHFFFKGMEVKSDLAFYVRGLIIIVDFYGLDTKKTLALDRKRIQKDSEEKVREIINSSVDFYLNEIEKVLFDKKTKIDRENNRIYTYWCAVPLKKKKELLDTYKEVFNNISVKVQVLRKKLSGQFEMCQIDFKEAIKELKNTATIGNLLEYTDNNDKTEFEKKTIIENVVNSGNIPFSIIVIDKGFTEALNYTAYSRIMVLLEAERKMYLREHTTSEGELPILVGNDTKKYLFNSLLRKDGWPMRYSSHRNTIRKCIIGIAEYKMLCVKKVPFGIDGEGMNPVGHIISPVTIKQWNDNKHLEKDEFIDLMCSSDEFSNLVEYVYLNQIKEHNYNKEEIEKAYRTFLGEVYVNCKNEK